MAAPKITLYFDIVSPFAYMAFHILRVSIPASSTQCTLAAYASSLAFGLEHVGNAVVLFGFVPKSP